MKRPWIWTVIVVNLIGLIVLAFVYPSAMLSQAPSCPRMPRPRETASSAMRPFAAQRPTDASAAMPCQTSAFE